MTTSTAVASAPATGPGRDLGVDLLAVLPAWLVARVLVIASYVMAVAITERLDPLKRPVALDETLIAWDGTWYRQILEHGYDRSPIEAIRFFPLYPFLAKLVGYPLGGRWNVGLVLVANLAALALAMLVRRLVILEKGDEATADRVVWVVCLFPASFVLVWGYAEALMLVGVVGALLAARSGRWWWAVPAAAVAAISRPVGACVVVALAIEASRGWRSAGGRERLARLAAVATPMVAAGLFVLWDRSRSGEWLRPFTTQGDFRGDEVDPLTRLWHAFADLAGGERFGDGLHAPFALLFVVLLVLCFRVLPASYGAYATAVLVAALSAENLNSLERYGLNAIPLLLTLGLLAKPGWRDRSITSICAAGFVALCTMAWLGAYVP